MSAMRPLVPALTLAVLLVAGRAVPAVAETTNTTSIAQMMLLEPGDKNYRLFRGAVWLEYDKASYNYRWGGLQCPGKDLSENSIQILFAAFRSEYAVTLEYVGTELKGKAYRCITGFTISKT